MELYNVVHKCDMIELAAEYGFLMDMGLELRQEGTFSKWMMSLKISIIIIYYYVT